MYGFISTLAAILPLAAAAPTGYDTSSPYYDSNPGCQASSTKDFAWEITGLEYHASYIFTTPAHQNSWGYVNFNLSNPALTYNTTCSASSDQLSDFFYGTQNYKCTNNGAEHPSTETTFNFNWPTRELNINQSWVCADEDPQWPVTFHAWGNATYGEGQENYSSECTDQTTQNANWTLGQIYSDREVKCEPVSLALKPYQMTAVA
ncbi:hypothetical protein BJ166DRAFT_575732 [Pestalotiopsis sp. NC0098]|nr:hypothetical protein BJ166DRAFT_575732 [Pestalotiopsis sp. NC0098]